MSTIELFDPGRAPSSADYPAPFTLTDRVVQSWSFEPDGFQQFVVTAVMPAGTELVWSLPHGDEAIYVVSGGLEVDGEVAGEGAVAVLDSEAAPSIRVVRNSKVIHHGSIVPAAPGDGPYGPPLPTGGVRVIGPEGHSIPSRIRRPPLRRGDSKREPSRQTFFSDGTQPTSRIVLFKAFFNSESDPPTRYRASSHYHTQDEIITVLDGELVVAGDVVGPGMSMALQAFQRYTFQGTPSWMFLNFRRDVSWVRLKPTDPLQLESRFEVVNENGAVVEAKAPVVAP